MKWALFWFLLGGDGGHIGPVDTGLTYQTVAECRRAADDFDKIKSSNNRELIKKGMRYVCAPKSDMDK